MSEKLRMWVGDQRPDFEGQKQAAGNNPPVQLPSPQDYIVELSGKTKVKKTQETDNLDFELTDKDKVKILLIEKFVKALTGKKIKIRILEKLRNSEKDSQGLNDEICTLGNSANELQGQVVKTGVFVNENGTVGTVQQIDLTV
ncbi:MAG: hypothetical protein ACYC21_05340 [Eubacteriales bacterium]